MTKRPLDPPTREQLRSLIASTSLRRVAAAWQIDRGTLAEAALGEPKQSSTRCLIEVRLKETKVPI